MSEATRFMFAHATKWSLSCLNEIVVLSMQLKFLQKSIISKSVNWEEQLRLKSQVAQHILELAPTFEEALKERQQINDQPSFLSRA